MTLQIESVNLRKDTCVVDQDPEFADMVNPEGFIYARCWFVHAVTSRGERYVHNISFAEDEHDKASRLASRIEFRGDINLAHWSKGYNVYGSQAWEEEDLERQVALRVALTSGTLDDIERYS